MTRHDFHRTVRGVHRLRRWPDAILLGVCSAIALRLGIRPLLVRIAAVAALIWAPVTSVALYLLAAVLLARNPAWRWPA